MNSSNLIFDNTPHVLVTLASWEERFKLGTERILSASGFDTVLQFYFRGKSEWTAENRKFVQLCSNTIGADFIDIQLDYDMPAENWKLVKNAISSICTAKKVIVDISTMPRDIMWNIFDSLLQSGASGQFIYWKPAAYNKEWLSRDPGRPRLALGHGGISEFGKKTLLAISIGYDVSRVLQLINFFEPQKVILFSQTEPDNESVQRRIDAVRRACGVELDQHIIDFMNQNLASSEVSILLDEHKDEFNTILASQGPKPSAVTFYNENRRNNIFALAYTPSHEFNIDYSRGIGDFICGPLMEGVTA